MKQLICSVPHIGGGRGLSEARAGREFQRRASLLRRPRSTTAPAAEKPKPVPAVLPDPIARVNSETISKAELEGAIRSLEQQNGGRSVPPERRDEIYRGVLDNLLSIHVLRQEVVERHDDRVRRGDCGARQRRCASSSRTRPRSTRRWPCSTSRSRSCATTRAWISWSIGSSRTR